MQSIGPKETISIHASAREATLASFQNSNNGTISIHASAREATVLIATDARHNGDFNPRLREGGDSQIFHDGYLKLISIHASAREAT